MMRPMCSSRLTDCARMADKKELGRDEVERRVERGVGGEKVDSAV